MTKQIAKIYNDKRPITYKCTSLTWVSTGLANDFATSSGWDYPSNSVIIDPHGDIIAGPAEGETILIAEGSSEQILLSKAYCDTGGHYTRPDVFQLHINRKPTSRIVETNVPKEGEPDIQPERELEGVGLD